MMGDVFQCPLCATKKKTAMMVQMKVVSVVCMVYNINEHKIVSVFSCKNFKAVSYVISGTF
jgi:hypothetical protein